MAGETDLTLLLKNMQPVLLETPYVFLSMPNGSYGEGCALEPIAMVMESEGMTLVVPASLASAEGHNIDSCYACISLQVHSSLDAVGLTAAFSTCLADVGISANVLAGFHHDHIFVPFSRRFEAMAALAQI